MGITNDKEAIFIDFEKNNFNFLIKIVDDRSNQLSISYWYQSHEYNLETVETKVPQERLKEARSFIDEVNAYAVVTNGDFMADIQQYKDELSAQTTGPTVTEEKKPESSPLSKHGTFSPPSGAASQGDTTTMQNKKG
jgi:hypothetical protein